MTNNRSEWYCSVCGEKFQWGEGVVLVSAGTIDRQYEGPVVDSSAWWDIYHHGCYEPNQPSIKKE